MVEEITDPFRPAVKRAAEERGLSLTGLSVQTSWNEIPGRRESSGYLIRIKPKDGPWREAYSSTFSGALTAVFQSITTTAAIIC